MNVDGMPYVFNDDGSSVYMDAYGRSKYGYHMSLESDGTARIGSVYNSWWSAAGTEEEGMFRLYKGTKNGVTKEFMSLASKTSLVDYASYDEASLKTYGVSLYKLTNVGTASGINYTLTDKVGSIDFENVSADFGEVEGVQLSGVGGITNALNDSYIEQVLANDSITETNVNAKTYAHISANECETGTNEWNQTVVKSVKFTVTPHISIYDADNNVLLSEEISDSNFKGDEMEVTLCVGSMSPKQIIHYKEDGTKEYFYSSESEEEIKPNVNTFDIARDNSGTAFVSFKVSEFSDVEVLYEPKAEDKPNAIEYDGTKLNITVDRAGTYSLIFANYIDNVLSGVTESQVTLVKGLNENVAIPEGVTLASGSGIYLWENLASMKPLCKAVKVD